MPAPPPPPPGPPPPLGPPPQVIVAPNKNVDRGALLKSIQQGTKLKKAVTHDRSAPVVGKQPANSSTSNSSTNASSAAPNGLALGGLFAGGMPKLRPTGRTIGYNNNNNAVSNSDQKSPGIQQKNKSFSTIQSEVQSAIKKQMASDSNRNRGPPPPAPVRNVSQSTENLNRCDNSSNEVQSNIISMHKKSYSSSSTTFKSSLQAINAQIGLDTSPNKLQPNTSTLHRKANSSANLSVLDSPEPPSLSLPGKPANRKPNLAPKPPILNGKPAAPPKRLMINGRPSGISRAQSMRSPRTPSPQSPDDNSLSYQAKFGTVRNLSSVLDKSLGQNFTQKQRPALNGRPSAPPPSAPTQQAPPPPPSSKTVIVKPPNHAPPPPPTSIPQPPSHPPPPPPLRTQQLPRAPPAVPGSNHGIINNNNVAPPPPPRHSSMRDNKRISPIDLEQKYRDYFHSINELPNPPIFRGFPKIYSSRNVLAGNKQQAPMPPNHVSLSSRSWDASTC